MTWRCFCGICTEVDPLKSCRQVISKISEIGSPQYNQWTSYNKGKTSQVRGRGADGIEFRQLRLVVLDTNLKCKQRGTNGAMMFMFP